MSKGTKRNSARKNERLFRQAFPKPQAQKPQATRPAWLDMTDESIDLVYFTFGKADRTRMKREAALERLRLQVKAVLQQDQESQGA